MSDARSEYFTGAKQHCNAIVRELTLLTELESAFRVWCDAVRKTGVTALECYDKAEAVRVESPEESEKLTTMIIEMKAELDRLSALHPKPTEIE